MCAPIAVRLPPPRLALRALLLDHAATDDDVDELVRVLRSVSPAVMATRLAEVARVDVREALGRLRCPTLYLAGARDRLVGRSALDVIRVALPSVTVATIDAPHLVLQRRASESARVIGDFLRVSR